MSDIGFQMSETSSTTNDVRVGMLGKALSVAVLLLLTPTIAAGQGFEFQVVEERQFYESTEVERNHNGTFSV